jgi:hypothetical protein
MSNLNITYGSKPIYTLVIARTGKHTEQVTTSVLFYDNRDKAEAYSQEVMNTSKQLLLLETHCTIIETIMSGAFIDDTSITPKEFSIEPIKEQSPQTK